MPDNSQPMPTVVGRQPAGMGKGYKVNSGEGGCLCLLQATVGSPGVQAGKNEVVLHSYSDRFARALYHEERQVTLSQYF